MKIAQYLILCFYFKNWFLESSISRKSDLLPVYAVYSLFSACQSHVTLPIPNMEVERLQETMVLNVHFITSLSLSLSLVLRSPVSASPVSESPVEPRPKAMHSSARSALECIVLTFKTKEKTMMRYMLLLQIPNMDVGRFWKQTMTINWNYAQFSFFFSFF